MLPDIANFDRVYVLNWAVDDSSINSWDPTDTSGSENNYAQAIKAWKHFIEEGIVVPGTSIKKRLIPTAFLWQQGEADLGLEPPNSDGISNQDYVYKLKAIVEGVRDDLALPKLPFVTGSLWNFFFQTKDGTEGGTEDSTKVWDKMPLCDRRLDPRCPLRRGLQDPSQLNLKHAGHVTGIFGLPEADDVLDSLDGLCGKSEVERKRCSTARTPLMRQQIATS